MADVTQDGVRKIWPGFKKKKNLWPLASIFCKTCAADVLVGAGMPNRAEMYTREEAIKNKRIQFRSKTIGPDLENSFTRPWGFGAWPSITKCWQRHVQPISVIRIFTYAFAASFQPSPGTC
jgi:hypothetical protein